MLVSFIIWLHEDKIKDHLCWQNLFYSVSYTVVLLIIQEPETHEYKWKTQLQVGEKYIYLAS